MNDHFSPVGKPAPPRPRRPEAFISAMIQSRPLSMIALVPSQAPRRRAPSRAPVLQPVEIAEDAILVVEHELKLPFWDSWGSAVGLHVGEARGASAEGQRP